MKLMATLDGQMHELEIAFEDGRIVRFTLDGETHLVDAQPIRSGVYSILAGRRSLEVCVERSPDGSQAVLAAGARRAVKIIDPRSYGGAGAAALAGGRQEVRAPMPGKIVRVMVEAGDMVQTGQGLLVVEAMKMQNEIKAAIDGEVVQLSTSAGDSVAAGQVLAVLE